MKPASRSWKRPRTTWRSWGLYILTAGLCGVGYAAFAAEGGAEGSSMLGGTLWDIMERGGYVMYWILGASVVGLGFVFESAFLSRRSAILPVGVEKALVAGASPDGVQAIVAANGTSSIHRVLAAGYRWRKGTNDQVAAAIEEVVDEIIWQMKRSARPIGIVANTAPLLGLLGTVVGIIEAFGVVAEQGALGDPGALAGGISKALLTTWLGLIVAIPMLLIHHYFTGRIETLVRRCEILAKQNLIMPPE